MKNTKIAFTALVIAASMLTSSFALTASAKQTYEPSGAAVSVQTSKETEGDYRYNELDDGTVEISGYIGRGTEVIIPSEIDGKKVTRIGVQTFYCSSLTSVTIPDSVTSIGNYAFESCSSLVSVTIPDSVTAIGDKAFYKCSSLTSVTIPDSVTTIGGSAFSDCSSLVSVTIPDSVTTIDSGTFFYCSSLASITIPDSVTTIGYGAFEGCKSLTSVTIPNSVTTIGASAFEYCKSLVSVTIPDSVTTIGYGAFEGCKSLTSVTIPDSVTTISYGAFEGCSLLTIYGYSGSYAEQYANDNSIPFVSLGDVPAQIDYHDQTPLEEVETITAEEDLSRKIDVEHAEIDNVREIQIDETTLPTESYTLEDGCVVVNVKKEYLETLGDGEHTLKVVFNDGVYESTFVKQSRDTNTETDTDTATETDTVIDTDTDSETPDVPESPDTPTDPHEDHTPGDVNGDGKVNMKDLTRLHQYINGWDVEVVESALDINGDGKVNMKDLTRLHQYLNGWDAEIK